MFAVNVLSICGKRCVLCGLKPSAFGAKRMLVAGHIKPWKDSAPSERLDLRNGLAARPDHDVAFDTGLLTVGAGLQIIFPRLWLTRSAEIPWLGSITAGRRFLSGCSSPMTRSSLPASDWHKTKVFIA